MGRLTLNVLLSFAQFEREVTSEPIKDKIEASRKRGMWMGGSIPLGYDNHDKKLFVNEEEAKTIRAIFNTYLNHPFIDGNKRTAFVVSHLFLKLNGANLKASQEEKYNTFLNLATGGLSEQELANWITRH